MTDLHPCSPPSCLSFPQRLFPALKYVLILQGAGGFPVDLGLPGSSFLREDETYLMQTGWLGLLPGALQPSEAVQVAPLARTGSRLTLGRRGVGPGHIYSSHHSD